jgi:hypothetical protein
MILPGFGGNFDELPGAAVWQVRRSAGGLIPIRFNADPVGLTHKPELRERGRRSHAQLRFSGLTGIQTHLTEA